MTVCKSIQKTYRSCVRDIINIKTPKSIKLTRMKNIDGVIRDYDSYYF